jgi:hypothetical protein
MTDKYYKTEGRDGVSYYDSDKFISLFIALLNGWKLRLIDGLTPREEPTQDEVWIVYQDYQSQEDLWFADREVHQIWRTKAVRYIGRSYSALGMRGVTVY